MIDTRSACEPYCYLFDLPGGGGSTEACDVCGCEWRLREVTAWDAEAGAFSPPYQAWIRL